MLGGELAHLARPYLPSPDGVAITRADYRWLSPGPRHPRAVLAGARVAGRVARRRLLGHRVLSLGQALAAGRGRLVLFYANRDEHSVIFGPLLRELAASAAGRLVVVHWLDSLLGLPSVAALMALARPYVSFDAFICGPDPYLAAVREALAGLGVPGQRVHVERFVSLAENPFEAIPAAGSEAGMAATLSVTLDGATTLLPWPAGTRMLDVLIEAGLDAPYSCRQGICGACACQLTGGKVDMAHNEVLEAADIADGYVLACQAVSLTPEVSISY